VSDSSKIVEHTGFYAWLDERLRRGSMVPTAPTRLNNALRTLAKREALQVGRFVDLPQVERRGDYRVERITLARANAWVTQRHRHLNGTVGHKFSLGLFDDAGLRGVAIVGRPVARGHDNGHTLEILRVATDGSRNACSKLLSAVRKEAQKLGALRLVTYTLPSEGGASLRGSGFVEDGKTSGGRWDCPSRARGDRHPTDPKTRWVLPLAPLAKPKKGERATTLGEHSLGGEP
jgi:hypothetical protein